jgi:aspartyl-tRNA(Asn)/glutamyl-tRNA(Gln) amidotransferase subunit B
MPDADLPPVVLDDTFIEEARASIPLLPEYLRTILLGPPHNLEYNAAKFFSVNANELEYYYAVLENIQAVDGRMLSNWYLQAWIGWFRIIQQLVPQLKKYNLTIRESPFTVDCMVDLFGLLAKGTINSTFPLGGTNRIDDRASTLLKSYFPVSHSTFGRLPTTFEAPLQLTPGALRGTIRNIIKTSKPKPVRDGMQTLETFYMGLLMGHVKGRIDPLRAREVIREEAAKLLDIIPPAAGRSYYTVRKKDTGGGEAN